MCAIMYKNWNFRHRTQKLIILPLTKSEKNAWLSKYLNLFEYFAELLNDELQNDKFVKCQLDLLFYILNVQIYSKMETIYVCSNSNLSKDENNIEVNLFFFYKWCVKPCTDEFVFVVMYKKIFILDIEL